MATGKNGQAAKRRPVWSKKYWPVEIAVFEYVNGDERPQHSVKLTKSFRRDEESEWETTDFFSGQDLLPARELLGEAYRFIQARLQRAFESRNGSEVTSSVEADAEAIHF
jgi:hypothetical protein